MKVELKPTVVVLDYPIEVETVERLFKTLKMKVKVKILGSNNEEAFHLLIYATGCPEEKAKVKALEKKYMQLLAEDKE